MKVLLNYDTFVSSEGRIEEHHYDVGGISAEGAVYVKLDYSDAMDGGEVKILEYWPGTYVDGELKSNHDADAPLPYKYDFGHEFEISVEPEYQKERLSHYAHDEL